MNRAEIYSKSVEHKSTRRYRFKVSPTISSVLQLDNRGSVEGYGLTMDDISSTKSGDTVTATLAQLKHFASFIDPMCCIDDGGPQITRAITTCRARLEAFITGMLRDEGAHTIVSINNGALKVAVHCSCGWSCGRDTTKLAKAAHVEHAVEAWGATP